LGKLLAVRKQYLHVMRPPKGMGINQTSVQMLAYAAGSTDLPPYILHSKATHEAIFVIAKRDRQTGSVVVDGFPGLPAAIGLELTESVTVVDLMTGETVVPCAHVGTVAATHFSAVVETSDARIFLVKACAAATTA
jgi:hypothetical protein